MSKKYWTSEEIAIVQQEYARTPTKQLAEKLGRSCTSVYNKAAGLGLKKNDDYLSSPAACRLNGSQGESCRFGKGHVPHNKGDKGWQAGGRSQQTQFKPGHRGGRAEQLHRPVGSERVTEDGYLQRKTNEDMPFHHRWKMVHNLLWEEAHGKKPAGHIVVFKNGNKQDLGLDNLELISRAENMRRNTIHRYPAELKKTIRLAGKLRRTINEK